MDAIVFINLDQSTDRLALFQHEMRRMGMQCPIVRVPGHYTPGNATGCHHAHLDAVRWIKTAGYENAIIMEDDIEFTVSPETFHANIALFLERYGSSYDAITLVNYKQLELEPVDGLVNRVKKSHCAVGYMVNQRVVDRLIDVYSTSLELHVAKNAHWLYTNDVAWQTLQATSMWYGFGHQMCINRPCVSIHSGRFENHNV